MDTSLLPPDVRELFHQFGHTRSFLEGETLISLGQPVLFLPFIVKGSIRVSTEDADGRELLLYYLDPGESCIATLLTAAQTLGTLAPVSTVKAVAEENTEVIFIPQDLARNLILENPDWNRFVFSLYQKRFEELLQAVNDVAFSRMDERLTALLLKKTRLQNATILYVTHQQLADELGTVREVVSRLLKRLELDGQVELQRGKIKVFLES